MTTPNTTVTMDKVKLTVMDRLLIEEAYVLDSIDWLNNELSNKYVDLNRIRDRVKELEALNDNT